MGAIQSVPHAHPIAPEDRARADLYGVLARLFYAAPDAALLEAIAASDAVAAPRDGSAIPAAWHELRRAAQVSADAVRTEYDALFIGVGKPEVMLYASWYLAGFLHERPLVRLRGDLAALGCARRGEVAEPEDHIAALADVMRLLILDETVRPPERDAAQREFFARHIEPWYGRLCEAVEAAPGAGFYRCAARLAHTFLDNEKESFDID